MPRPAGEAAKLGDFYEAIWTVDAVLDVFEGRFQSITVEAFGEESVGVEFHLETNEGALQFHSVKRQKQDGDWSIAKLCQKDEKTGRSILGDLLTKRKKWANAQTRFVSATGANELRELEERAETPAHVDEFRVILSPKLRSEFDSRIVPLFDGDTGSAFKALKTLEVILRTHKELSRSVERRIAGLLNRVDGSELRADEIRRMIAEFVLKNLGPRIDRDRVRTFLRENGIGVQDWKLDVTVNDAVTAANRRYLWETETELINSTHIARDVVGRIIDSLTGSESRGVLVVAPGGFGKSCVLAQCLEQLTKSGTPHLCLRMDAFTPCTTARQLGQQMDLRASPAVVLAGIADNAPSALVVDQLDAMSLVSGRNPKMWDVFRDLCDEVRNYPRMKLVLACRDFDLEHDHRLRSLGDIKSGFSKFSLAKLTEAEIYASLRLAGHRTLELNPQQLEILGVPFHLLLYLQGDPARGFKTVGELYNHYWKRKRQNLRKTLGREPQWNEVVDALTTKMSEQQLLFAPMSVTDNWELDAQAMASEHVLIEVKNNRQYRFFHESFFDYAYARRFCAKERNLVELLQSSEQHLFRRAQVRQILEYRREEAFEQYIADVRSVFESPNIRFHIKRMVASSFNRIDQPRPEEWQLLEKYVLEGELSRYVSSALRDHVGWFDALNSLHVFENWLASNNPRLNDAAIWYLESHRLHDYRSTEIAQLIRPYSNREGDWRQRIQRIMSWGQAYKSIEMADIYIDLIAQGAYDDFKSRANGGDFWTQHYDAEIEAPRFLIDVLATWFDRVVHQFDDGKTLNFLDNCSLNHSHTGAMMIGKAAAKEPGHFIEQMLPRVRETVLRTQECRAGEIRNRTWPWLSNHGIPFKIDDAILLWLRKSLQNLAKSDVEMFRRYASTISNYPHQIFGYLLLRSWASNPEEFANDCAEYLIADQRRLNIGYAFYSVSGEGTGECAISRIALEAITPHCSVQLRQQLESRIIGYCDEYEKQTPQRRGFSELLLLRSLAPSKRSEKATLRIEELERKFPKTHYAIVEEDETNFALIAGSPITHQIAERMTDDQWISAMSKYDGSTDSFQHRSAEFSQVLADFARKDRNRFAALVEKMPDAIEPIYFSAILDGLCGGYQNLSKDEKEADTKHIATFPLETFLKVIDRLHALPNRPCGSAIVNCIRLLSNRPLASRVLEIVSCYATNNPDPKADIWQDTDEGLNYYGGDPYSHGINCVRGRAAEAISSLLYNDHSRFSALRPALLSLSKAPVISVRTCAISAYLPLLNFSGDFGVELFLNACDGCEAICATHTFEHFIHEAIQTHYDTLRNILQFALKSSIPEAVQIAARQITLAELQDVPVGTDLHRVIAGSEDMRKAAAGVYATNLSHEAVGRICAERLGQFFSDNSEGVRRVVSSAFHKLSGELLLQLKDLISRFIESPCFENSPDGLLHALRNSTVELPEIICRAAERILEFLGEEGTQIANYGPMTALDISTLIVRQYEQTTDEAIKTRCLNLIDQMERIGYFGIGEEFAKVDR